MYQRFLNNSDYFRVITQEALNQMIRKDESHFAQAEEAAEITIIENLTENGYKFNDIRLPAVKAWQPVETQAWQPREYQLWEVVQYKEKYYTLISTETFDANTNPHQSPCWGLIADYDKEYNQYKLSATEYIIHQGTVYYPIIDVNSDTPEKSNNIQLHDPRNPNLKNTWFS